MHWLGAINVVSSASLDAAAAAALLLLLLQLGLRFHLPVSPEEEVVAENGPGLVARRGVTQRLGQRNSKFPESSCSGTWIFLMIIMPFGLRRLYGV